MSDETNSTDTRVQGEGNYDAAKRYDESAQDFVKRGKVQKAAQAAAPQDEQERKEMEQAEQEGLSHARGTSTEDSAHDQDRK